MKVIQLPERPRLTIDLKHFEIRPDTIKMDSENPFVTLTLDIIDLNLPTKMVDHEIQVTNTILATV